MTDALYPPTPAPADTSFLEPSSAFKNSTNRMIIGIVLFIVVYFLILAFAAVLLLGSGYVAFLLVSLYTSFITIMIGLGLFGLGVMFFYFTTKFIFGTVEEHEPIQIEIKEKDHPLLFDFIRKLSNDVGTKFPKKIFLTPDVNASVTYNSSFWSMFFPVRKNLRIGLGLVNTLNLSEFKATVAHEFGHFSQKSMRTGSYVYTMNRVMYDLVYQRDDFEEMLQQWASWAAIFSIFASLTNGFVGVLRRILHAAYGKINITYLALSREMEYHADLVAVSAAGNEAMINTLRKIEFAGAAYQSTMSNLRLLGSKKKRKAADMYDYHSKMILSIAEFHKLDIKNGMPIIRAEDIKKNIGNNRLMIKDQWASHPSIDDREASMNRVSIQSPVLELSAWSLFTNPATTKQEMTTLLYDVGVVFKDLLNANDDEIGTHFAELNKSDVTLTRTFYGFYDYPSPSKANVEKIEQSHTTRTFADLVSPAIGAMAKKHYYDKADLETLIRIAHKMMRVDLFEYDGVRYTAKDAKDVRARLQDEITRDEKAIADLDAELTAYFHQHAKSAGQAAEFIQRHQDVSAQEADLEAVVDFSSRLETILRQIQTRTEWREDQVSGMCRTISQLEKQVKNFMRQLPGDCIAEHFYEPANVFKYMETERLWNSSETTYNAEGFSQLHVYVSCLADAVNKNLWTAKKRIYDQQLALTPAEFVRNE